VIVQEGGISTALLALSSCRVIKAGVASVVGGVADKAVGRGIYGSGERWTVEGSADWLL
jgi:hypothetical protein